MYLRITHLLVFVIALRGTVVSQTNPIPNAGFEVWSGDPQKPTGWTVRNYNIPLLGKIISADSTSDKYSGNYALLLDSAAIPPAPLPGIPFAGNALSGLFACSLKPAVLKGFYKYFPKGSDTAMVRVYFTHFNFDTGERDTIGEGVKYFRNTVENYTAFFVPLVFEEEFTPDSASISIYSSSITNPATGSSLYIDELEFFTSMAGVESKATHSEPIVYPNPTSSFIYIGIPDPGVCYSLKIYDLFGRQLMFKSGQKGVFKEDLSFFKNGLYLYNLIDDSGGVIANGKISINK